MSDVRRLHRESMEMADRAFIARRDGEHEQAIQLFTNAYRLEYDAAQLAVREPSRSILHRSAATLALHAQMFREAERVVALGLAGDPPPQIANELREVFEKVNFHRHLTLQGIELNPNELQMTIAGNAVSEGMALIGAVFNRVQNLEKLVIRTAQRLNQKPFSRMTSSNLYSLYMSTPRTGSFAVTLRVGEPQQQMFPEMDDRAHIIDEVIYNLELLNENRIEDLRHAIPDRSYFESFLGIVKTIAPDGNDVRMVGVTTLRNGVETSVGLSVTSKEIKPILAEVAEEHEAEPQTREPVQITGELLFAQAINQNIIKIVDDNNRQYSIEVSEAIAEDVVRPYFGTRVTVDAIKIGERRYIFRDINPSNV